MTLPITCPTCAASFTPADDLRGKKAFCPKCGASLIVTSFGVAKRNETRRPVPARTPPARGFNPLWLLLPLLLFLLLLPGGLALYLFTRGHPDEPKQVAKNEDGRPPEPERKADTILPAEPERKADTSLPTKPEVILLVQPVRDKPQEPQPLPVKHIKTLGPMTYSIIRLAFSPDDKTLAAAGWEITKDNQVGAGGAKLWDVGSGKETATLNEQNAQISDVAFSPDGKSLTMGTWTGPANGTRYDVKVWDLAQPNHGKTVFTDKQSQDDDFRVICLSPDGKVVASGNGNPRPTQLLNAVSGATISTLKLTGSPLAMVFSPDSKTLASTTWTGETSNITYTVTIWDVASGSKLSAFTAGLNNQVGAVAFSPDSKTLAAIEVVEKTPTVVYWDVAGGKKLSSFPVDGGTSLAISPGSKTLAVASAAGLHLYDLANGKCVATLHEGGYRAHGVAAAIFSHDGKWLAAACSDKMIRLWEMPIGEPGKASPPDKVLVKETPVQPVPDKSFFDTRCMALSRDGKTLATAGLDSDIRLWDLSSGKLLHTIPCDTGYPHMAVYIAISPDGKTLAVKFWGATNAPGNPLWLYDVASGKHTMTLQGDGGTASLSFSPDGKTLLAGQGPAIATWDVASGKARIVPPANTRNSFGLSAPPPDFFDFNAVAGALRPDGKILATLGMSGSPTRAAIRVWDTANGRLLGGQTNFTSFYGARGGVAFSPDGKTLLWGGGNELKLFDVASGKNLASYTDDKTADIVSVAFSSDGKTAATGSNGNPAELKLWDLTSGKATVLGGQANLNSLHTVSGVVFTPDGRTLISQSLSEIKLWDVASGKCVRTLEK